MRRNLVYCCALTLTIGFYGMDAAFAQAPFSPAPQQVLLERGLEQLRNGSIPAARHSLEMAGKQRPLLANQTAGWALPVAAGYSDLAAVLEPDTARIRSIHENWESNLRETFLKDRIAAALSNHYFERQQWETAIAYGQEAGIDHHSNEELAALKFRTAYAYFNLQQFDKAEPLFQAMKGLNGPYQDAGYYYYGLLAYLQNRFDDALGNLRHVADHPHYKTTVPYFLAELKYLNGDRNGALADALKLLQQPDSIYYRNELELLTARLYFENQDYALALPHYEAYYQNTDALRRETLYEMGYSYFRVGNYRQAVSPLQPITSGNDSLAQLSASLLGDSYYKAGDKRGARNAYLLASQAQWYPQLQSDGLLKSAALAYEDGLDADALRLLQELKNSFPAKAATAEARNLRAAVLLRNKNYRESLEEALAGEQTPATSQIVQRAAYGYALSLLQENNNTAADSFLRIALRHPSDVRYETATYFWLSETAYRTGNYAQAVTYADAYMNASAGHSNNTIAGVEMNAATAALNKGYALLAQKKYPEAQAAFAQARKGGGKTAADAALREADMVLMQKNFAQADKLYKEAAGLQTGEDDYALLQRANLAGIQGNLPEKQRLLQQIMARKPTSVYASEARYEAGLNLIEQDKFREAIALLQPLTTTENAFTAKALLRIGQTRAELDENNVAIQMLTTVVEKYPGTPEQRAALDALRGIYTESGNPEAYVNLAQKAGINANASNIDSVYFTAAEAHFAANRYDKAAVGYSDYLSRYPSGTFAARAAYYAALSYDRTRNNAKAQQYYQQVLQQPHQDFTPLAAGRLAELAEADKDTATALSAYEVLYQSAATPAQKQQAAYGLLRITSSQGAYSRALPYADELLADSSLTTAQRQNIALYRGNIANGSGDSTTATREWQMAMQSKTPAVAAEARYYLAQAQMERGHLTGAEATAMTAVRISGAPEWWNVKAYLLLAEIFRRQQDYFNARATLESIVKNAKIPAQKAEAAEKLQAVRTEEKSNSQRKSK